MKTKKADTEVETETGVGSGRDDMVGLLATARLSGKRVTLLCANYIYTGKLIGVSDTCVKLGDPEIVYETGAWTDKSWKDSQALPTKELFVQLAMVESFGVLK